MGHVARKDDMKNTYEVSVRRSNATVSVTSAAVWQYEVLSAVYVVTLVCRSEGHVIIHTLESIWTLIYCDISDVWLTVHRNSVWIRKTN